MIVLVKINHPRYTYHPPQGLLYIADSLRKNGYDVKIFHVNPDEVTDSLISKIIGLKPVYVGFSVFTGEMMRTYARLCRKIKSSSKIPVVWGNAHPSMLPEECLKEDYIDFVVIGEGEITSVELANYLQKGTPELKDILGLGFTDINGNIIINPRRPFIQNLDDYKPAWDLIDVAKYLTPFYDSKKALPVSTSRGCPFDCGFCYNREFNKCQWRAHSADYIVSSVKELQEKYQIDGIITTDDNFFVNKKRAFEIVERLGLPYYCETRANYFDEGFADELYRTKGRAILLGLESGSDRILKFINKKIIVQDSINAVSVVSKYPDIWITGSFIVAFPTETEEECRETMKLIVHLLDIKKEMCFTLGYFLPYPGSNLYQIAIEQGFIPPERTEDWEDIDRWANKCKITWVTWITSEKAVTLRKSVTLLASTYNSPLMSIFKNYVKQKVLSLDIEGWGMSLLIYIIVDQRNKFLIKIYQVVNGFFNKR